MVVRKDRWRPDSYFSLQLDGRRCVDPWHDASSGSSREIGSTRGHRQRTGTPPSIAVSKSRTVVRWRATLLADGTEAFWRRPFADARSSPLTWSEPSKTMRCRTPPAPIRISAAGRALTVEPYQMPARRRFVRPERRVAGVRPLRARSGKRVGRALSPFSLDFRRDS